MDEKDKLEKVFEMIESVKTNLVKEIDKIYDEAEQEIDIFLKESNKQ